MERFTSSRDSAHVVIAGGGFAAVEALLALWALGSKHVRVTMVAREPMFSYRPAATAEAFAESRPRAYDLRAMTSEIGATFREARLVSVGPQKRYVRLSSGLRLTYDALVLATGARPIAAVPGAVTFRDQRDVRLFRCVLQQARAGAVRRLAFAVPSGCCWPLPLYELALLTRSAAKRDLHTTVTLVSPEEAPLAVFGPRSSELVGNLLAERRVSFVGSAVPDRVQEGGSLVTHSGGVIEADRVVAAPRLRGRKIVGIPVDGAGFVPTDASGCVPGLADVYAAGDMTASPIKHGGIATQQADRIAHQILAGLGVPVREPRTARVLQVRLIGGERPLFLRAELDEQGRATSATLTRTESEDLAGERKVLARYLTPYLEATRYRSAVALSR